MFELNGTEYTLEQVKEAALASKMSVEEYTQSTGLKPLKTEAVVVDEIAPATAESVDTELQSVDSLLGLQPETVSTGFGSQNTLDEVVVTGNRLSPELQKEADKLVEELPEKADKLFSNKWQEENQVYIPSSGYSQGTYITNQEPEDRVKFIKEAKAQLETENFGGNLLTEDQVLNKAKTLWQQDQEKGIATEVVETKLGSLNIFEANEAQKLKNKESRISLKNQEFDKEETKKIKNRIEKIQETAKNTAAYAQGLKKTYSTEKELEDAQVEFKGYMDELKILDSLQDEEFSKIGEINDSQQRNAEALDIVRRNYGTSEVFAGALAASTIDIASGLYATPRWLKESAESIASDIAGKEVGIPSWMVNMAVPGFGALFGETSKDINDYLGNISENIRGGIAKPVEVSNIKNAGQAGNWIGNLIGSQLPIMATMITMPNASLAMLGSSAAGGKFLEMEKEIDNGQEYSGLQLLMAPAMVGGAEYLTERVSLGQLNRITKAFKGENTLIDNAKRYIANDYVNWAKDMGMEGGAEVAATYAENIADRFLLGKEDVSLTRGLVDSFASGAVMSGFIYKFPVAGSAVLKAITGPNVIDEMVTGNDLIKSLSKELVNPKLSLEEKSSIQNDINDIRLKQTKLLKKSVDGWDNLNKSQQKRLFEIDNIKRNVGLDIGKIARGEGVNAKLSKEARNDKARIQIARYDALQDEKDQITSLADEKNFNGATFALEQFEQEVVKGKVPEGNYVATKSFILSEQLDKLYSKRNEAVTPAEMKFLDLKIKNTEEQLKFITPKAAGLSIDLNLPTIATSKNIVQLGKAFVAKSQELLAQKNNKQITQEQYQKQYKLVKNAFVNKRSQIQEVKGKTKSDKYTKLQDFYNKSLDKNGNFIENTKTSNEFGKIVGGIVESATKRLYDNIPSDLRDVTRDQFKKNLEDDAFLMINRENFDPSLQSLDRFISNRLNLRANRVATKSAKQDGFTESISENPNLGSAVLEDVQEQEEARQAIETARAMQIPDSIINKARKAAMSALSTISNKVDATKFKSEIAKTLKDVLYSDLKNLFGKNTKTKQDFTKNLKENIKPFYDVLTTESMRKARNNKTGINPFVELGLLDVDGNKVAFENIDQQAFIDFYTKVDNTKKGDAQKLSDRRMNLIEAVASSLGAAQAIDLLNNDAGVREKFLSRQAQENETAKKGLELLVPKGFTSTMIDVLNKISSLRSINQVTDLLGIGRVTVNDSNRLEKQEQMKAAIIAAEIPSWMLEGSKFGNFARRKVDGVYVNLPKKGGLYWGTKDPAYIEALELAKTFDNNYDVKKPKRVSILKAFTAEGKKQGEINLKALEFLANKLANSVAENKMSVELASLFISSGYQATTGIIKIAAPFRYKSKLMEYGVGFKQKQGEKFREEHNPPASVIGATLIWAIANNKVAEIMPYIKDNYYQTQLSKKDDERIDNAKLDATLPEGFSILDNPIVRLAKAGIDLNSIINPETGKTIAEENNVQSASTPDAVAASNAAAVENNIDQVENLIDRAIAKLTELTGDNGTLQMNLGAVPINVLIGGLRATKLAYQGSKSFADALKIGYKSVRKYMSEIEWADFVGKATYEVRNEKNFAQVKLQIMSEDGIAKMQEQVRQGNYSLLKDFDIDIDGLTTDQIIEKLDILRKAKVVGSNTKAPTKKARVFDFDDTLAKTNSKVLYTLPDGTQGNLDATQFAEQFSELQDAGATFDYSEFSQVKEGSKGPLAILAKRFTEAKGDRDVFVLTARPANANIAIQEFLRATLGISIPLQNITGLANGKPGAKAMWVAEKVSEGYNDVFFADDVAANVKAVADMLDNLGVTKRVQQAKENGQRSLEDEMDSLIRGKKRSKIGKLLSRFNIYIPPGADDFAGLLKYFQAKGKLGDEQMKWFQDNLLMPFAKGISAYTTAKVTLANDFKALNKRFKNNRTVGIPTKFRKMLSKEVLGGMYTNEQAVRAYLYDKAGQDLGLNKADTQDLIALVEGNAELKAYAQELSKITKLDAGYPPITDQWLGGSVATDMAVVSNKAQRAEFLQEFTNNKNQIFSDQNMKLIKQEYGNDYADALSNILERMETGQNRKKGKDKEFNSAMNWINQSVGAVMAINMRSAILQQMSIVNYMNWNFNNPIKMGIAMANVPQFMEDYMMILNSDFLKERRGGMSIDVNLSDIADSNPGNLFLRLNKKVLELGFKPTQWGDSNAIAFGGATWYRNRYNQLIKEGISESDANAQAMLEFQEVSETAQQSSRVDKVSRQQASDIGRLILAFANTPLQYARETRKATSDLVNGRGDWKTNISKILYYGVAQNILFTALQQGLFSLILSDADDEEYEKTDKKLMYSLNSVADGILRGMGYAGAVVASLKNLSMEYYDQKQKRESGKRVYDGSLKLVQAGLTISPPISKKISDIVEGQKFETWKQYKNDPFYQGFAYANYFSGLTNLPADRIFKKIENLKAAAQDSTEAWQSVALSLGWSPYNVGVDIEYKKYKGKGNFVRAKSGSKSKSKSKSKSRSKSALNKVLPKGVLGRANNDGTIELADGLKGKQKREVIAHEKKHISDMKSGKLNYDDNYVYYNDEKHKRTNDDKIVYKGRKLIEGSSKLPWEAAANKVEKQVS